MNPAPTLVTIVQTNRAGPVLSPIAMPCQGSALTVNATRGCAHGCVYCYARDYRGTPLEGEIHLYSNLAQRLEEELARGRRRPSAIRFSTASDPFQPLAPVQEATYQATEVLLRAGFRVSFLTKGAIPEPFHHLLAQHPGQVYAQVGLCSLDPLYQQVYEPGAAPPGERLRNIQRLLEIGVPVEARLDPLIPSVTDNEYRLAELLAVLAEMGVKRAVASYLMLRPAIARRLKAELAPEEAGPLLAAFQSTSFQRVAASEHTQLLPAARRAAAYGRIRAIARKHGIALTICRCKNPELGSYCHAGEEAYWGGSRVERRGSRQMRLL